MNRKILGVLIGLTMLIPIISTTVIANGAPSTPTIEGPTSGKPGFLYDYTFMSIDPDGDDIFFMVSWGCCGPGQDFHTYGPFESGEEAIIQKGYGEEGTYTIQAYAKDMDGAESNIVILEVTMPKEKKTNIENKILAFGVFSHCEVDEEVFGYILIGFSGLQPIFNTYIQICDTSIQKVIITNYFLYCIYNSEE
jgi:hypothetical protein